MLSRVRDSVGETMTETLVSILISALALTVLATVIGTSVNLVSKSRDHMKAFYEAESNTTQATPTNDTLEVEVPLKAGENTVDVKVYASDEDSNIVYYERSSS